MVRLRLDEWFSESVPGQWATLTVTFDDQVRTLTVEQLNLTKSALAANLRALADELEM